MEHVKRCSWAGSDALYISYHDREWGVPVRDDRKLFEMLCLEGAQAGLSWITILRKRQGYLSIFHDFDPNLCAEMADEYLERALLDTGIVRNRLKVYSVRSNARAFLDTLNAYDSFSEYIWQFTGGQTKMNSWDKMSDIPASTKESDAMSKDLKRRGFKFVGSTICYAFMQACGMVNDHTTDCFRYAELSKG